LDDDLAINQLLTHGVNVELGVEKLLKKLICAYHFDSEFYGRALLHVHTKKISTYEQERLPPFFNHLWHKAAEGI
jgi:hypothetical protein